jgi:uncharacterized protein YndB with AHSA1/START domain
MFMTKEVTESALIVGSPDEVWPLVTHSQHFRTWYAFGGADIDLRPGGAITLRWDEHGTFDAVVESVIPKELFSFRWRPEPGSLVEIKLQPEGNYTTLVQIVESGELENPEQSALAWRNGLALLSDLARSGQDR